MIFASPLFLFAFLPALLLAHAVTPARWANGLLLLGSILFYSWGAPDFVAVVLGSALLDLAVVRMMVRSPSPGRRRAWVALGVIANLAVLAYFKYASFAFETLRQLASTLLGVHFGPMAAIILPIGVSFIVFEKITYIVDVHRGVGAPAKRVSDYLLYVFLFPKLLAGPIVKYHDIEGQLGHRPKSLDDLSQGLARFALGLGKKVLLADPMAEIADATFGGGGSVGFGLSWLGALAFSLQIFFDFSGYSDMAIGLGRVFGFRLMENFDRPYLASGFGEFWRRWHISLSTWIRDYLYVPLGGSRVSSVKLYANLWLCFLASGLWHGAAWTFVLWGAYHGFFLTLDRLFAKRWLDRMPRSVAVALTFGAVTVGWVVFRATSIGQALSYARAMVSPGAGTTRFVFLTKDLYVTMLVGLALCFAPLLGPWQRLRGRMALARYWPQAAATGSAVLFFLAVAKAMTVAFQPFLYFRF